MHNKIYFVNLDILRSIAAILVLLSHIVSEYLYKYFPDAYWFNNPVTKFFLMNGGFGVQIFFSLSGFLITYLLLSEMKVNGKFNLRNFYIRRALRIWPVYFMVLGFVFIIYGGVKLLFDMDNVIYESPLMSVLFLSNYDLIRILGAEDMYANGMLSLTWSVSVEEQFYLFWPLVFLFVGALRIRYAIIGILVISIIFMFWGYENIDIIYHHTISNLIFLGTGALLAYFKVYEHKSLTILFKIPKSQCRVILSIFIFLLVFSKETLFNYTYGTIFYFFLSAGFLFFLLLILTKNEEGAEDLGKYKMFINMAKYTYGLYMYHRIAGFLLTTFTYKVMQLTVNIYIDLVIVVLQFIVSFILAYLSYKYIEQPVLRYKDKFSVFHK